jgi:hypothetical protein
VIADAVLDNQLADSVAELHAGVNVAWEVQTGLHDRASGLVSHGFEARSLIRHEVGKNCCRGGRGNRVLGWIGRACRCWQGCIEARIDLCGPWSVVRVLGVPGRNGGVVDRNVEQRRGAVGEGDAVAARRSQCDLVPAISWRACGPVGDALQVALIDRRAYLGELGCRARPRGRLELSSSPGVEDQGPRACAWLDRRVAVDLRSARRGSPNQRGFLGW